LLQRDTFWLKKLIKTHSKKERSWQKCRQ